MMEIRRGGEEYESVLVRWQAKMIYTFRDWASCKYVGNLKRTVPVFWDPRRGMYVKAVPYPPGTVDAEGKVVPMPRGRWCPLPPWMTRGTDGFRP